jgi:hypothetical protein
MGGARFQCPPAGVPLGPEPGWTPVGRIEPDRRTGRAHSQPQAPERERIAHGRESPGGTTWDLPSQAQGPDDVSP